MIIDAKTMEIVAKGRDSKQWITDLKYSPDSSTFALSSADEKIYIYSNHEPDYNLKTIIEKHNAKIMNIDYSQDSSLIQSTSEDYEHLFRK